MCVHVYIYVLFLLIHSFIRFCIYLFSVKYFQCFPFWLQKLLTFDLKIGFLVKTVSVASCERL